MWDSWCLYHRPVKGGSIKDNALLGAASCWSLPIEQNSRRVLHPDGRFVRKVTPLSGLPVEQLGRFLAAENEMPVGLCLGTRT